MSASYQEILAFISGAGLVIAVQRIWHIWRSWS